LSSSRKRRSTLPGVISAAPFPYTSRFTFQITAPADAPIAVLPPTGNMSANGWNRI